MFYNEEYPFLPWQTKYRDKKGKE